MTFVCRLAQHWEDFRIPELESVAKLQNIKLSYSGYNRESPFIKVNIDNESDVKRILDRAILVKDFIELLAEGDSLDAIHEIVKEILIPASYFEPFMHSSFKFVVKGYGRSIPLQDQLEIINSFSYTALRGPIQLTNADVVFAVFFDTITDRYYFGRLIGKTKRGKHMDLFSLKKRTYLGTTSMDAELSLVMTNMGLVDRGHLVYDPFVGTGSFLYTTAYFGGFALGSDIDGRQMRGKEDSSIQSNINQYGLGPLILGGFVFDLKHNPWTRSITFDSIITDPPYGVRAGAKKLGSAIPNSKVVPAEFKPITYPATQPYATSELTRDLLDFASIHLKLGGRLVFWYPVESEDTFDLDKVTEHASLSLIAASVHKCKGFDRWLITMEKIRICSKNK